MTVQNEYRRRLVRERVGLILGNQTICSRCGATYKTMNEACIADLVDRCPGFNRVDEVQMPIEREVFGL